METIEYLKSPELVYKVQTFFGIKRVDSTKHTSIEKTDKESFTIASKFLHYFFLFGTELGDELFYSMFIPFWFWNIDGYVGRRVVLAWAIVMYTGQGIKDIVRWPRPGYPAVRVQQKWALEYGMPSTHAMVGVSIPFSVLLFTLNRYKYTTEIGLTFAVLWCLLICVSRVYLGMHTVLDILAGLALAIILMFPLVPCVNYLDNYFLTNPMSPILILMSSILMIVYYPNSEKWTPTRGDTTMIISVTVGLHIGAWLNYQTGNMSVAELSPPYEIYWPSQYMCLCIIMRMILGLAIIALVLTTCKRVSYNWLCALLGQNPDNIKNSENSLDNKHKTFVELSCKFISCAIVGLHIVYFIPLLFRSLGIERPTFYTEI